MEKKIITVFGATGAQGGGLVRAILSDTESPFAVRAVTRDANSEKINKLKEHGAEIVVADIDDKTSVQKALEGAYGAYFVTFFWDHFSPEKELQHVQNFAEAAKAAGIQHAIYSTLEDTREIVKDDSMPTLMGKYKVPHFDGKGEGDHFFKDNNVPTTYLLASFYWENFIYFGAGPKEGPDGKLALTLPIGDAKMGGIASEDIGKCAYGIFKIGKEMIGKRVGLAGEHLTGKEMATKMSNALDQDVVYNEVSPDVYRGFGFPGAEDLGNMFQFYADYEEQVNGIRDIEKTRELNLSLQNFDRWLEDNAMKIPLQ